MDETGPCREPTKDDKIPEIRRKSPETSSRDWEQMLRQKQAPEERNTEWMIVDCIMNQKIIDAEKELRIAKQNKGR